MKEPFMTVHHSSTAIYEEKKSKFIADVGYVSSEEGAAVFLDQARRKYKDASHHTYAYSIVTGSSVQRFSDGGEPSGTAGIPILEVIKRRRFFNTMVVVTRYFGGILLGAPGLARAYGKCAAMGLDEAGHVTMTPAASASVTCSYADLGRIQSRIAQYPFKITATHYTDGINIEFSIPSASIGIFTEVINGLTDGKASIVIAGGDTINEERFDIF